MTAAKEHEVGYTEVTVRLDHTPEGSRLLERLLAYLSRYGFPNPEVEPYVTEEVFEAIRLLGEQEWPHGLRCSACGDEFIEGQPIAERLEAFQDDIPMVALICMACDVRGAPLAD